MDKVIVGIHGLANKPEKSTLAGWWEASIREGLSKNEGVDNPEFAYVPVFWADLLYHSLQHMEEDFNFDPLYNDQPYTAAGPGELAPYQESRFDRFRSRASERGGSLLGTLRKPLRLSTITDLVMASKLRDLDFYYDASRRIRGRDGEMGVAADVLRHDLTEALVRLAGKRVMLIAHSMGSIIAYDVLRDLGRSDTPIPIHHLVTIGSPLGLGTVKENVKRVRTYSPVRLRTPTVVSERWVNYADRRDPVALDTHLSNDYKANDAGVSVEDELVRNSYVSPGGAGNPHKSYGYLRTPELSRHIAEFLASGAEGPSPSP